VIAIIFFMPVGAYVALADSTWTQTSQADFESGTPLQVDTSGSPGDVMLSTSDGGYFYALGGNRQKHFWRYDPAADSWESMDNTPQKVKWGGDLAYDGGNYIYALRGYHTRHFWRYDIAADSWDWMADTPGDVKEGGALTYHPDGYIYALRGDCTRHFWRYDISTDSWAWLADTNDNVSAGGALTNDGDNYVYAFQCVDTEAFYRYDISADSWTLMADTPGDVGNGADLTYDGGNYIYALRGKNSNNFWRYDISADSWSGMTGTPCSVDWGGALAYDGGGYVYALRGKFTQYFWRYDISTDSWVSRHPTPASVAYGGALTRGPAPYYASGTLTSSAHDTGYAANFTNISWNATTPPGTSIKFQIATNNDNSTWNFLGPDGTSGTYYTSSQAVWSGHDGDRYIRYRAYLGTTDNGKTPVLHDVGISYALQIILPTVSTGSATAVEETTATLHGSITDDGGEACQYRFEYGTSSGNYTTDTGWTGSKTTGQSFYENITGLGKGTKYYFRAQAKNSAGTANGLGFDFLTKPDPPYPFTATAVSDTQINLTWTKGDGAWKTMVRRDTGGYPADRDDGFLVYFDTGTAASDTGLTPNTTYYYRAWSYVSGSEQWSDAYTDAAPATTGDEEPEVPPLSVGGTVLEVNKAQVLAPWLGLFLAILLAAGFITVRLRKQA